MGALTSKPYAFVARSWELKSIESIDVFDSYLSSVRYDYRGTSVLRVLPVLNEIINQEWINDRVRFFYDSIQIQRISSPWLRSSLIFFYLNNLGLPESVFTISTQISVSWTFGLEVFSSAMSKIRDFFSERSDYLNSVLVSGHLSSLDALSCAQLFSNRMSFGSLVSSELSNSIYSDFDSRSYFTVDLSSVEDSDAVFLVGFNPRLDSPIFNLKLRDLALSGKAKVFSFMFNSNLNYRVTNLGIGLRQFIQFLAGRTRFSTGFLNFNFPVFLVGSSVLNRSSLSIQNLVSYLNSIKLSLPHFRVFFYPSFSSTIGTLELGYGLTSSHFSSSVPTLMYSLGFDDLDFDSYDLQSFDDFFLNGSNPTSNSLFNVYHGSHGDAGASMSHVLFPSAMHVETNSSYLSVYGDIRKNRMVLPPLNALVRSDSSIFTTLLFSLTSMIRFKDFVYSLKFYNFSPLPFYSSFSVSKTADISISYHFADQNLSDVFVFGNLHDFYLMDSITRSSKNLSLAASLKNLKTFNFKQ